MLKKTTNWPLPLMSGAYEPASPLAGAAEKLGKQLDELEKRLWNRPDTVGIHEPEDIAAAVAFLVQPDAGFITAQVLTVDGGRMDYISHG